MNFLTLILISNVVFFSLSLPLPSPTRNPFNTSPNDFDDFDDYEYVIPDFYGLSYYNYDALMDEDDVEIEGNYLYNLK